MRRPPKKVTIMGRTFDVKIVSKAVIDREIGEGALGGMSYSKRLILILEGLSFDDTWTTYFHECCHAIQFIVGLNQITPGNIAEIWCESMANGFMDIIGKKK